MSREAYSAVAVADVNSDARMKREVIKDGWLAQPMTFNVLADGLGPDATECLEVKVDNAGVTIERIGEPDAHFTYWQDVLHIAESNRAAWTYDDDVRDLRSEIAHLFELKREIQHEIDVLREKNFRAAELAGLKLRRKVEGGA